jgi:hypothetical protein
MKLVTGWADPQCHRSEKLAQLWCIETSSRCGRIARQVSACFASLAALSSGVSSQEAELLVLVCTYPTSQVGFLKSYMSCYRDCGSQCSLISRDKWHHKGIHVGHKFAEDQGKFQTPRTCPTIWKHQGSKDPISGFSMWFGAFRST